MSLSSMLKVVRMAWQHGCLQGPSSGWRWRRLLQPRWTLEAQTPLTNSFATRGRCPGPRDLGCPTASSRDSIWHRCDPGPVLPANAPAPAGQPQDWA